MPAEMVSFLEREGRAGAQLHEARNQWHADSASKKCQFYEPGLLHTDCPSFIFLGDLLYKSTHTDFVLSLHKTLYKWRRIEEKGVYSVNIKTEHQLVIVSGRVDSATLIKKLIKSGKRAELWSLRTKNKRNQEQLNANQLQFLANDFSDPQNQFLYPASFDNEIGNTRTCGDFLNQNVELKAMNVGRGQDLMAATRMGNFYMDDDNFAGSGRSGDDFAYMMGNADYRGSGTGFAGLGGHEFNGIPTYEQTYRPSMIMSNKQQRYHYNHPATEMHNYLHARTAYGQQYDDK
ncbi:hypothetical protein D5086_008479 [Populus alba]|uniref:Uncharacterized protein n=2 Tax=Populus alba TaxID=43335 RepID=A0ACC4CGW0_POPAL|nr:hypothetical protein D5086_0000112090 [Populus alba]